MEELKRIEHEEFVKIYEKEDLTREDRIRLQSYVAVPPLSSLYSDLKNEEIKEVHKLETENIYRFFNAANVFISDAECNIDTRKLVFSQPEIQQVVAFCDEEFGDDKTLKTRTLIYILIKYLLSNPIKVGTPPAFVGKMPQKFLQFRQQIADDWFVEYVKFNCQMITLILTKCSAEEATSYLFASTAYYLNKSQTYRFYPNSGDMCDNERIRTILLKWIDVVSPGNCQDMKNNAKILFKDL